MFPGNSCFLGSKQNLRLRPVTVPTSNVALERFEAHLQTQFDRTFLILATASLPAPPLLLFTRHAQTVPEVVDERREVGVALTKWA